MAVLEVITSAGSSAISGRYHQVKRMFAAVGNVVELHRERGITLDADLAQ